MKIFWYASDYRKERDNSLNILYRGIAKASEHTFLPMSSSDLDIVLASDADAIISTYRAYDGENLFRLIDKFGKTNCFNVIWGFRTKHEGSYENFRKKYERIYQTGIKLIVSNEYCYRYLTDMGLDGDILKVGLDLDIFPKVDIQYRDTITFGMCFQARKSHRKGVDIIDKLKKYNIEVKTAGNMAHNQIHKFYESIDCLLVASDDDGRESFCLPIMEALAMNVPVITTPVGCSSEVIKNSVNGYIVADKNSVIDKVNSLTVDEVNSMKNNCRASIASRSWEELVKSWDKYFEERYNG